MLNSAVVGGFPSDNDGFALVSGEGPGGASVTAVGDADLLRNSTIATDGRAALALGLLGGEDRLVWYSAHLGDSADASATTSALAPGWSHRRCSCWSASSSSQRSGVGGASDRSPSSHCRSSCTRARPSAPAPASTPAAPCDCGRWTRCGSALCTA